MDLAAIDAGSVDAGLRKFISSILVALVDEYVVVDPAGDDVKFGMRDMSCGELGVVLGRRLGIARADHDVGRHGQLPQPGLIHAEGLHDPGRAIANTALTRLSSTSSAGAASSGSSLRRYSGTIWLLRQPRWKARYLSGLTVAP